MITKRPCIPVAQINGLSGMTDRHSYAHTLKIFIMVATRFQKNGRKSHESLMVRIYVFSMT